MTGSYGAAVGAQHETHQRLSCGFHMEGPPQNKKGKEKKKGKQDTNNNHDDNNNGRRRRGGHSLFFSFFLLLGRPFLFLMIKFSGCEGGEKIVIIESSHKVKRRKEKKEIEREQQQLSDGPHSRNNKERLSRHLVRLLFSLLSLSRWVAQLGQQTGKPKGERRRRRRECGCCCCCVE